MKKTTNKKSNFIYYLAGLLLLSVVPAFYVWNNVWYSIFIVVLSVIFLTEIVKHGYDKKVVIASIFFFFILCMYLFLAKANLFGVIEVLCLLPLFFAKQESIKNVYNAFLKVFALVMGIGLVFYIIVIWFGVSLPNEIIAPYNRLRTLSYHVYPFFVTEDTYDYSLNLRFYGLFDEPGVVGTISAILLLIERFNLKKWENVIILLSGVFSFSLFFFIAIGLYILLEAPMKGKIVAIIVTIVIVVFFYENEILYNIIFHRFNISDGHLEGMNREHNTFSLQYEQFRHSSDYWFGLGVGTGEKLNEGGSSYKQFIINYGIVFFVFYLLSYYIYALSRMRGFANILIFSIILLGTMYQRPFVGTPTMTFLMISASCVLSNNKLNNNNDDKSVSVNYGRLV